jgi:hypothetical protein
MTPELLETALFAQTGGWADHPTVDFAFRSNPGYAYHALPWRAIGHAYFPLKVSHEALPFRL